MTRPVEPSSEIQSPSLHDAPSDGHARASCRRRGSRRRPTTHGLPMPRATTAACEVMPPVAVRMPCAASMPWMSSGVVSLRTRITRSCFVPQLGGGVGVEHRHADRRARRGGEAVRDHLAACALGSRRGCSSWSSDAGSTRSTASSLGDQALASPCRPRSAPRPARCACRCASAAGTACLPGS